MLLAPKFGPSWPFGGLGLALDGPTPYFLAFKAGLRVSDQVCIMYQLIVIGFEAPLFTTKAELIDLLPLAFHLAFALGTRLITICLFEIMSTILI